MAMMNAGAKTQPLLPTRGAMAKASGRGWFCRPTAALLLGFPLAICLQARAAQPAVDATRPPDHVAW